MLILKRLVCLFSALTQYVLGGGRWLLLAPLLYSQYSVADCTVPNSSVTLGPYASSVLSSNSSPQITQSGSGFRCTGSLLSLVGTNTIDATVESAINASGSTMRLHRENSSDYVPYSLCMDSGCGTLYNIGSTYKWSRTTFLGILGLFNSSDGTMPIFLRTSIGNNVAAGVYTDTLTIKWDYKLCAFGIGGLCFYDEGTKWSTLNITMTVTNDCNITNAPNINFGTAALPASFAAVTSGIGVNCTRLGAYTVKLTSSHPDDPNWRRMTSTAGGTANYLQYQLYRSDNMAWTETNDYAGVGSGIIQTIPYTARINANQGNKPVGSYHDTVTVTVTIN
ncbi:spore coat U domain-containing protein [Samsonia erythrinae]|uniref:Spore coat protein U-like protein n=1 Tax=Samsonia erythrinae TaxID=160434 RepID=A0A4V2VTI6_9GAMM|nr:spore coat U domain-containing protein [Samsonia erythrinae]TCV07047.1 spore coat protein U-like protein [Samsonia erythrinae]